MAIWELRSVSNDFAQYVAHDSADMYGDVFELDGKSKHWSAPPQIEPFIEKRRKKSKPVPDIGYLVPGSVTLNKKAFTTIGPFLAKFGQLLPMSCDGATIWLYNPTNVFACIDLAKAQMAGKAIIKPAFLPDTIPPDAQVFTDPRQTGIALYLNEPAKTILQDAMVAAGLTGATLMQAD